MAMTERATADGLFDDGGGHRRPARAALSDDGLAIFANDGAPITVWRLADLVRASGPDGFRIGAWRQAGLFVFDPATGGDLIRALAVIPDADAPMAPHTLVRTMLIIVAVSIVALVALAWGFFWLVEWLVAPASGPGATG